MTLQLDIGYSEVEFGYELTGFGRPFGLRTDPIGRLHVTDMDLHTIFRFDVHMSSFQTLNDGHEGWEEPQKLVENKFSAHRKLEPTFFNDPHSIDFGNDNRLYVNTYYSPLIHILNSQGILQGEIGGALSERPLTGPATAFFDRNNRLFVSEYTQNCIIVFDIDGEVLSVMGDNGDPLHVPGSFDRVHMCKQAPDGNLVVTDTWNHRLQHFTHDGQWLGWLGVDDEGNIKTLWSEELIQTCSSSAPGGFNAPVAVSFDTANEKMLVTDWGNNRLQVFSMDGGLIDVYEEFGLNKPYDAIYAGNNIVVADTHNSRVLVLEK